MSIEYSNLEEWFHKVSKKENKKPVSINNFNSKTSEKISKRELEKIIN